MLLLTVLHLKVVRKNALHLLVVYKCLFVLDIVGIAVGVTVTILFILVLPVVLVLYKRGILKFKRE